MVAAGIRLAGAGQIQGIQHPESRPVQFPDQPCAQCYKLGKRRFSYNQVELVLGEAGGGQRRAAVTQAAPASGTKLPAGCQVRWALCLQGLP